MSAGFITLRRNSMLNPEVSGHDFSRAVSAAITMWALALAGFHSHILPNQALFRSLFIHANEPAANPARPFIETGIRARDKDQFRDPVYSRK